jgi:1,2-diacylglycerol 3-beta-galactosyltransferase
MQKQKILFFMSDTGGGHRASAQAIQEAINFQHPDTYEIIIEDIWRWHTPWPVNKIPGTYPWLAGPGQPLWKFMWASSIRFNAHKMFVPSISPVLERKILRYLAQTSPDMVVSVHPLMNHLGVRWLRRLQADIPFITVVTDMVSIHPLWVCPDVTHCMVPTAEARDHAISMGMPPHKLEVTGQPVSLKFSRGRQNKSLLQQKFGLDPIRKTVLLVGGGEGTGRLFEISQALAHTVPHVQLLIVAGRNQHLKEKLEAAAWPIPAKIFGFVDNMPELMSISDLLVTKAGPGTISEAFISGLPVLISGYIPGQEYGNVIYVQEHQAGGYAETPQEIARLAAQWTAPGDTTLQTMAANASKLARPTAALDIAARIHQFMPDHLSSIEYNSRFSNLTKRMRGVKRAAMRRLTIAD